MYSERSFSHKEVVIRSSRQGHWLSTIQPRKAANQRRTLLLVRRANWLARCLHGCWQGGASFSSQGGTNRKVSNPQAIEQAAQARQTLRIFCSCYRFPLSGCQTRRFDNLTVPPNRDRACLTGRNPHHPRDFSTARSSCCAVKVSPVQR